MRKALMVAVCAGTLFLTAAAYQHGGHEHKSTAQLAPKDDYAARGVTAEADGKPGTCVKSAAFRVRSTPPWVSTMQAIFRSIEPMRMPW